MSHKA
jgi:hypothetical protein